jgi:hypothetical protein
MLGSSVACGVEVLVVMHTMHVKATVLDAVRGEGSRLISLC